MGTETLQPEHSEFKSAFQATEQATKGVTADEQYDKDPELAAAKKSIEENAKNVVKKTETGQEATEESEGGDNESITKGMTKKQRKAYERKHGSSAAYKFFQRMLAAYFKLTSGNK